MDVIMDYHLIFVIVSILLYLITIFLLFTKPDKEQLNLAIVLAATNIFFLSMSTLGFFRIGLVGIDLVTGNATVNGYEEMYQFYMVFFGLELINGGMIVYAFLYRMKLTFQENFQKDRKPRWRDG